MALVLADRVQETTTTTGTTDFALGGAVTGFQTFLAGIGNANTCYYTAILPNSTEWEVGIGTVGSAGAELARTTILASSASGSKVTFSAGQKFVFVTYPAEKSVNLDASGNVSALGTVSSGTWQGSTVGVSYGGTGVTTSTGSGSVVLSNSPALTTPNLGTPSAVSLVNGTGLPLTTGVSGVLPTANGGTNLSSFTANGVVYASSTSALTTGSAMTFDGTNFGIGTSSPQFKLNSVQANASAAPSKNAAIQIYAKGYAGGSTYYSGIGFAMYEHTNGYWGSGIQAIDDSGSYGSALAFSVSTGSATPTPTEVVRFSSSGNLLVGNTTGTSKATISGVVESTTGGFKFPDGTTQTTAATAGVSQAKATALAMIFGL